MEDERRKTDGRTTDNQSVSQSINLPTYLLSNQYDLASSNE